MSLIEFHTYWSQPAIFISTSDIPGEFYFLFMSETRWIFFTVWIYIKKKKKKGKRKKIISLCLTKSDHNPHDSRCVYSSRESGSAPDSLSHSLPALICQGFYRDTASMMRKKKKNLISICRQGLQLCVWNYRYSTFFVICHLTLRHQLT